MDTITPMQSRPRRPTTGNRQFTAPSVMHVNGHFAAVGDAPSREQYEHGVQVINQDKEFNSNLSTYLTLEKVTPSGFNYHLISVFGSQSTGKSTLLNHLFGTEFGVMSEQERRQTTKGIWLSKNKREATNGGQKTMADNVLVMDVEGTDGRERGEDQDFERKSALFALATSEVLIVNIWEHQVGLYQGANMGLLKTVFEVNLQLFLKGRDSVPRSLLFFVIRDHLGHTPLANLQNTLVQDLTRIWSTLSKPPGLEDSKIDDYFDFAFAALPHKILQPEKFVAEVHKLSRRFREGFKENPQRTALRLDSESDGIFLPEYHRRIPADGFSIYASGVWDQIVNNKDLDLPTQQELLAQFRCDEIAREVMVAFDDTIEPLEAQRLSATKSGQPMLLPDLGSSLNSSRAAVIADFETEASRYHKGVYTRKRAELQNRIDDRLAALFRSQLVSAHKIGVAVFADSVSEAVRSGQKEGSTYDFARIVEVAKAKALSRFEQEAASLHVADAPWSDYTAELSTYRTDLDAASARLRTDEMRRLASRTDRWVRNQLHERIGLIFAALGSARGEGAPAEKLLWDGVWAVFTELVSEAETHLTERARGFDAGADEVATGLWRLRRRSWTALRTRIDEELMEGNILLKLRENFEDKFRYDAEGVPRVWRPTDDIEGLYTAARTSTLTLISLLSHFHLFATSSPPDVASWIGAAPTSYTPDDDDPPAIDSEDSSTTAEMTLLTPAKAADLTARFRRTADAVYLEAKRGALGGATQVPLYFYLLLLALGWNEIVAVLRSPVYFAFLAVLGGAAYVTYTLNLATPLLRMADAATGQAVQVAKERLRAFLEVQESTEAGARRPVKVRMAAPGRGGMGQGPLDEDNDMET